MSALIHVSNREKPLIVQQTAGEVVDRMHSDDPFHVDDANGRIYISRAHVIYLRDQPERVYEARGD